MTTRTGSQVIAIEEHYLDAEIDAKINKGAGTGAGIHEKLVDLGALRLKEMDAAGIDIQVLSHCPPGAQAFDRAEAAERGRGVNDRLHEFVQSRPDRFAAFATLPMRDPDSCPDELERCVRELGFKGALVNGFSQIRDPNTAVYLDLPQYWPFWEAVESLDVPFYLHPRNPLPSMAQIYEGHPWLLGPTWAFGQETAVHALRLMGSGLFDKYPRIQIILGHMGEGLPYSMWRVDNRNAWVKAPPRYPAKKKIAEYFSQNFYLTTSGNFRTQTLIDAILEIGVDRILFSTDWPFENIDHAAVWFDAAGISENDRLKIGRTNAARLFRLNLG